MAEFTYDPGLVTDDDTSAPIPNATGEFRATPDGAPLAVYDLLGTPMPGLATNDVGVLRRFSADVPSGYINFGSVSQFVASDQQQNALPTATAAQTAALAAQDSATTAATAAEASRVAAETAAGAATAPVDSAVDAGITRAVTAGTIMTPDAFTAAAIDTETAIGGAIATAAAEAGGGPAYSSVQQQGGTPVTQRPLLEVRGGTVTDDPITGATIIDVSTLPDFRVDLAADQALTPSSTAVQTITGFDVPMLLNEVWLIKFCIVYRSATAAGFKLQNTVSAGASFDNMGVWHGIVAGNAGTTADTAALKQEIVGNQVARDFGALGSGTSAAINGEMRVKCNASGSVVFRAAQSTADAGTITVMAKSWLVAVRVA